MTRTTHYNLKKPDTTDFIDVTDLNYNADVIDEKIHEAKQSGGVATDMIETSVETSATAAHAYAVGEHFIYNDTLYRATASISAGNTIIPDTNCVEVTVADELESKQDTLTFDNTPTDGSSNPVTSDGIFEALKTAGMQANWDENDSTAPDYIKNRTHYATDVWTQKVSVNLSPISGSVDVLCGQGAAGVQTLADGKIYKVTLGNKVWTGTPTKNTFSTYEYNYVLATDIGVTIIDEYYRDWTGWKAYITTGKSSDWYAHLTIEEQSGESITKLDNKYLDMVSSPVSGSTKPITAGGVYTALGNKIDTSAKGAANGVASLDSTGKVPSGQLPSYVDDVIEGYYYDGAFYEESAHTTLITAETGKIYIDLATDKSYRYSGSTYYRIDDISVDSALSDSSENPVQNKVIKAALDSKQNSLTFDDAPISGSSNPVRSGGVKSALDGKQDTLTFDSVPTQNSTKPVTSGGVYNAIQNVPTMTVDGVTYKATHFVVDGIPYTKLVEIA